MLGTGRKVRLAGALALLLVVAAYANSFENSFHFDDFHTVTDNPAVRSLRNVPRFFTDATTFSVLPANRTYRPVVSTSLALDYALGRGYDPLWFHLSTFCWFLLLLWLLFRLYRILFARMFAHTGSEEHGVWLALFGAAWFGLHPAIAETVNYVIQRGDLYCTLGCVAALVLYAEYPQRRKTGLYLLPLILALLSKPPAAVFPVLLFFWVLFFEHEGAGRWKKSAWAVIPSVAVVAMLLVLQSAKTPKSFTPTILSAAGYRLTQPYVWLRYCAELFLPVHLNVDTDLSPFAGVNRWALLGLLFLLVLLFTIWKTAQRRVLYPIAFGLLWFMLTQLPTSLYPLSEVENDHRMFFSFAGLIPGVVWAAWLVWLQLADPQARRRMQPALAGAAVVVLLAYGWGVHMRNVVWHDEESLWRDDAEKSPLNGRGLMIYGLTQMNKGAYPAALDLYNRALRYTPNYATLEINVGIVNGLMGNKAEAERHFQRALLLAPGDDVPRAYYGRWLIGQGRAADAVQQLRTAVALNPQRIMQHQLLIQALRDSGDLEGAKQAAAEMAVMFPGDPVVAGALTGSITTPEAAVWIDRSLAQYSAGSYQESIVSAKHALELDPKAAAAYNNIGAAYGAMGQWDEAVSNEKQALALDPTLQIAKNNLAAFSGKHGAAKTNVSTSTDTSVPTGGSAADWINRSLALNQQGKYQESIAAAQAALRLDASSAEAWNNIAANYEALHQWDQAIDAAQKAVALKPDFQLAKNNLAWSEQQKKLGR